MTQNITQVLLLFEGLSWAILLVFLRIGAMMMVLPAFGEGSVPVRIKLALSFAFCAIITPAIAPGIGTWPDVQAKALRAAGAEVIAGLFFGLMLRFFIMALQIAGTIAGQSTSLSQIFGGSAGVDPMPAMATALVIGGLALACIMGLHVQLARYMIDSYGLVPPGVMISTATVAEAGISRVSACFALAFTLAAPFVIGSLVYNITLGVINRAMPQLMVAFVGAPAITAGGLALLALAAPYMLTVWYMAFEGCITLPFGGGP